MGFLAPWFLVGFVALGVPLYLHLLRRSTSARRPFSSLLFFEPRTQTAVRHRRLRYLLLLALRLALLALLVLAFANPFISRPLLGARPARLVLLIIDRSFSMRAGSRLADAKQAALAVLARRRPSDRVQVMSLGSALELLTAPTQDDAALRAAVESIQPDDSRGELSELVSAVREATDANRTPIELHLFSDMQRSSLPSNLGEMALPDTVSVVLHPIAQGDTPNWTVTSVLAPAQIWGSAKDVKPASVQAVVAGFATPAANRSVSLFVNGKQVATQSVQVPASGQVSVKFGSVVLPHGFSGCEIRIDSGDGLSQDDTFRFAIERADPQQVLFIRADRDTRSGLYFGNALVAAEASAFELQSVTVGSAARLPLSSYAFVVLSNLGSLPQDLDSALARYVRAGGSVLVALGTGAAGHARVPLFDAAIHDVHDYAAGSAGETERFVSVGATDPAQSWSGNAAQWADVKFFYALGVDEAGSAVIARLTDQTPLLLEKKIGEGRVLLLTSGLEALTNDLPLHPAFVAVVSQLAHHLAGLQQGTSARVVGSFLQLHAAEDSASDSGTQIQVIGPDGKRPLSLAEEESTPALKLSQAGFYQLRRANGHQELIAVNVDPRESDLRLIPPETLALLRRTPAAPAATPLATGTQSRQPYSLWWFIIALALIFAIAQSWLADRQLRKGSEPLQGNEQP